MPRKNPAESRKEAGKYAKKVLFSDQPPPGQRALDSDFDDAMGIGLPSMLGAGMMTAVGHPYGKFSKSPLPAAIVGTLGAAGATASAPRNIKNYKDIAKAYPKIQEAKAKNAALRKRKEK
jgi:hypothetical protein